MTVERADDGVEVLFDNTISRNSEAYVAAGLEANTNYRLTLMSVNEVAVSAPSNALAVATLGGETPLDPGSECGRHGSSRCVFSFNCLA